MLVTLCDQTVALLLIGESTLLRTNSASRQLSVSMVTDILHEQVVAAELEAGVVSKLNLLPASRLT